MSSTRFTRHDPMCACSWSPGTFLWGSANQDWIVCRCGGVGCASCGGELLPPTEPGAEVTISPAWDWTTFYRSGNYLPDQPRAIRFEANRRLDEDEIEPIVRLVGYQYRAEVHGAQLGDPVVDSDRSFVLAVDPLSSTSKHPGASLRAFEEGLNEMVRHGTPVRVSDRAGPGTKGTRLLTGLGWDSPVLTVYYDCVQVEDPFELALAGELDVSWK